MVGWDIEFSCGPVPESATDVEVSAGNGDDVQSIKKESLSSVTVENGYVQFPAIKVSTTCYLFFKSIIFLLFISSDYRKNGHQSRRAFLRFLERCKSSWRHCPYTLFNSFSAQPKENF